MHSFTEFAIIAAIVAGMMVVVFIVAADRTRYLAQFDLSSWRERIYLRSLSNFLQALYDSRFKNPWPSKRNALSAGIYRFRLRSLARRHRSVLRRGFVEQHLALFALLEQLSPFIDDFILREQQRIVTRAMMQIEDTRQRDRLSLFVRTARLHRDFFLKSLSFDDRTRMVEMIDRRFLPTLRIAHAIFQEHGYSLLAELNTLREWESLTAAELAEEIPRSSILTAKRGRAYKHFRTRKIKAQLLEDEVNFDAE